MDRGTCFLAARTQAAAMDEGARLYNKKGCTDSFWPTWYSTPRADHRTPEHILQAPQGFFLVFFFCLLSPVDRRYCSRRACWSAGRIADRGKKAASTGDPFPSSLPSLSPALWLPTAATPKEGPLATLLFSPCLAVTLTEDSGETLFVPPERRERERERKQKVALPRLATN